MTGYNKKNLCDVIALRGDGVSVPYHIHISKSAWLAYGQEYEKLVKRHPKTWPYPEEVIWDWKQAQLDPWEDPAVVYEDCWGCKWKTAAPGIVGVVVEPALASDEKLRQFSPPSDVYYNGGIIPLNWDKAKEALRIQKAKGRAAIGGVDHGYYLLRLEYLRGFENLAVDMMEGNELFRRLVGAVQELNRKIVDRWISIGADIISLPEDLGAQNGTIIGPRLFREWAMPHYRQLHKTIRDCGRFSRFHTDGNVMEIADELCSIAPGALNIQDTVNGVENIDKAFKGRLCIDLDIDRQRLLPSGDAKEIDAAIAYYVKTLGSRRGGLMMTAGVYSDVSPENAEALVCSCEKYADYYL